MDFDLRRAFRGDMKMLDAEQVRSVVADGVPEQLAIDAVQHQLLPGMELMGAG